ncbi:amino acid ABC transporter permease [Ancylothrix sp. C2]|uniref:amino acid ABC transporter permease n=1 Tax=Ancylothrix sp. D3o TaxID=2953691 RepID=UPI0021BA7EA2|nr:amino acid ABC transporter permease [Ancylothrix sp. D3o]MCT7950709.1 amino acid ABC transporter permease [Ancylothrix sp. D3o]
MQKTAETPNLLTWAKKNLFNSWLNSLLTVFSLAIIYQTLTVFLGWLTSKAQWTVISENLRLFLIGRFPAGQEWRLFVVVILLGGLTALNLIEISHLKKWMPVAWLSAFPVSLWLIGGGLGLVPVGTELWNGLLLTLLMAAISIILSFPIGVLLALGRQSKLPVVRSLCIFYIEVIRGLPLIGILFMAQVMLPLLFPPEIRLDRIVRAIAGLTLFSSAYLAENVRGGLQSIPRGQAEAARALGLNPFYVIGLIVLPQALRAVIPAIVGQFISLFKDTTLLSIVGLQELMGMSRSVLAQPEFLGRYAEVYLFAGILYWFFCYSMALISQRLEHQLSLGKH